MIEGNPWFVAADICRALGSYRTANGGVNTTMALITLKSDEKRVPLNPIGGRKPTLISESGFYKVAMRSDKPEARKFQDWVTREVLPSIRKTGTYTMPGMEPVGRWCPRCSTSRTIRRGWSRSKGTRGSLPLTSVRL